METWAGDPTWTDITLSAELTSSSGNPSEDIWLLFRVQDKDNYYLFTLEGPSGKAELYKLVGGKYTMIKAGSLTASANVTYTIKVVLAGSSIKVYNGSTLILEAIDTQFSKGYVGLGANGAFGTFDNVEVSFGSGSTIIDYPGSNFIPVMPGNTQAWYTLTGKPVPENTRKTGLYLVREGNVLKKVMVLQ